MPQYKTSKCPLLYPLQTCALGKTKRIPTSMSVIPHAREVCLVLLCAIHASSGLLLSSSVALSPSAQRALPRRLRVLPPVAAEDDDLLASFRASTAPTEDQALKRAESLRDDEIEIIEEPSIEELVAKMPGYQKVRRQATALLLSPSRSSRASPCPTGHHRSRCRTIPDLCHHLDRPLIHARTEKQRARRPACHEVEEPGPHVGGGCAGRMQHAAQHGRIILSCLAGGRVAESQLSVPC